MIFATHLLLAFLTIFSSYIIQIAAVKGTKYVACGSVTKLMNLEYKVRLHSHDIKYGGGSGQQSVTGSDLKEDGNSYWLIKGKTGKPCTSGKPIKCRDIIRLEHVATKKNLHSHLVSSPLSAKQEVSAYGDEDGDGDTGDHWYVECDGEFWERNQSVKFKHVDTGAYLSISGRVYGNPINGQAEVIGDYSHSSPSTNWRTMEGMFLHPKQDQRSKDHYTEEHDEL